MTHAPQVRTSAGVGRKTERWQTVCRNAVKEILRGCATLGACGGSVPLSTSDKSEAEERAAWLRAADFVSPIWAIPDRVELDGCDDPPQYRISVRLPFSPWC